MRIYNAIKHAFLCIKELLPIMMQLFLIVVVFSKARAYEEFFVATLTKLKPVLNIYDIAARAVNKTDILTQLFKI